MIKEFKDIDVTRHDNHNIDIHIGVEFLNQPEDLVDPSVALSFHKRKYVSVNLFQQGYICADYFVDEIEKLQAMVHLSKQKDLEELFS